MSDRAVSEVLSYTLVFSLIVVSVLIISVSGVGTLENTRDAEQMNNAERAFDVLGDNIADLYERDAPSRATEISLGDAQLYTGDPTTINVTWKATATGNVSFTEIGLVPLVYEGNDEKKIVYEAGAVFRTTRDGGVRLRNPPMVFSGSTVLLSVIDTQSRGVQSISGSTVGVRIINRRTIVPVSSIAVERFNITVNSTSQRTELWAKYFEENGFTCDSPGSEVTCEYTDVSSVDRFYIVNHDMLMKLSP
ncbi:MAG: hypothetical protein V5A34_08940 [Halapricum sp.]